MWLCSCVLRSPVDARTRLLNIIYDIKISKSLFSPTYNVNEDEQFEIGGSVASLSVEVIFESLLHVIRAKQMNHLNIRPERYQYQDH